MLRVADHFSATDTGRQRRANEDSYFARSPVFVVADGMGGAQAGEVASRTAVELFASGLPDDTASPEQRLARRAREANDTIHALSIADAQRAGMGTTLTAALVGTDEVALAHVGDSRAYCLRDGELRRLTEDHSLVEELVRQGKLTEHEAQEHPQRSIITRALGPEPDVDVDTLTFGARAGDTFLLCSDGLTGMVAEEQVRDILASSRRLDRAGNELIAAANAAGGRDNITVVLFRLEEVGAAPVAGDTADQPTAVGQAAPSVAEVRDALARTPASTRPESRSPRPPRRRVPRMPGGAPVAGGRRRRHMPVAVRAGLAAAAVVVLVGVGGWIASQTVYFVGTDARGQVTVYRGLPYDMPAGVSLYQPHFVSGVTVAELSPAERRRLLNHKLRSQGDATDLVRRLELNQISQQ